jgi:glycosyltransferase involved in cell wall biosynthesis
MHLVAIVNKSASVSAMPRGLELIRVWTRGPKYFFQVLTALMREKPAVVHFQHEFFLYGGMFSALIFPLLLLVCRLSRMKVLVTVHGVVPKNLATSQFAEAFFVTSNFLFLRLGLSFITIVICKLANTVIVHNNYLKDTLIQDYKVSSHKIQVVPHGVGNKTLGKPLDSDGNLVLFFGNITPSKGIETLIEAFEQIHVPNTRLIIAGSPHPRGKKYFNEITQRIARSPVSEKITLTGRIPDDKVVSLFEECTVAVFPYTFAVSSSGGLSFAIQQRKPVIVTDLPTFTEVIVHGKNGLVVPLRNAKTLAEAIEKILLDKKLGSEMSQQIQESALTLAWSAIAHKTLECYKAC